MNDRQRGQILPLFALMLVALFAMAALAIDVSGVYAARRYYRTVADAAALAGGQDLQAGITRVVGPAQYVSARADAIASVVGQLGGTPSCTATSSTRSDCTLTDPSTGNVAYEFSVITPIPAGACATCDPARSVQVSVANPAYQLSFAHILGFPAFRVSLTSVAGLGFDSNYTIVALRPPATATLPDVRDIYINGGTLVTVTNGDVASNANMIYNGYLPNCAGSCLVLDSSLGYKMNFYDPYNPPLWSTPANPPANPRMTSMVPDPGYPVPQRGSNPPAGGVDPDSTNCATIAAGIYGSSDPNYAPAFPLLSGGALDMSKVTCYTQGVYSSVVNVNNGTVAILEPGLYFFDAGLDAQGTVIGGYQEGSPGVALVFPETQGTMFKNRTNGTSSLAHFIALNAGTKYLNPSGSEAAPAVDYSGQPITTDPSNPNATKLTLIVPPDPNCPVTLPWPASCSNNEENKNIAIDLSGKSGLYLAGVQYAPSDNISIAGNTATGGYVGQIWGWTLFYTGGSQINQEGVQSAKPSVLRLDAACTAPGTPCMP